MAGNLNWHGDAVRAAIVAELDRRLAASAILVAAHAKKLISVSGVGILTKTGLVPAKPGLKGKRVYGAFPSKPGEPPRKQRGRLRASVTWEQGALKARVGSNLRYALFLELGTSRMAARPWLRRAVSECQSQIQAILNKPMK